MYKPKEEEMTSEKTEGNDEAEIRRQIDRFVKAFRAGDVNLMMSLYAPGMVSFDVVPPLQDVGKDVYRKVWEETFTLFQDPIDIKIHDLSITTGNGIAFSHKLLWLQATKTNGQTTGYWERLTFCFRKIDDKWLIAHAHVSVPADLKSGRAVLDLKPQ
jgi:ketosteroid isomerase-like protein